MEAFLVLALAAPVVFKFGLMLAHLRRQQTKR